MGPNRDTPRREVEGIISQRDKLRKQVESLDRELRLAHEKLASAAASGRNEPQRERSRVDVEVSELKAELSRLRQEGHSVVKERDRLAEENGELRSKVDRLEMECQR